MLNLAAIVIIYNPEELGISIVIENIKSYSPYVQKIYLVDNSKNEHEELSAQIENSVYIFNGNKGGIGGAQNKGCEKAIADGFEWAMTMDMDTIFASSQIERYLQKVEDFMLNDDSVKSFSLAAENITPHDHWSDIIKNILRPIKRKIFGERKLPPEYEYKDRCIASANVINLAVWKAIGGFDERLFIDQVDYDFCYRLRNAEFNIVKFNTVHIDQHFGEAHGFTVFRKKYMKYSSFRYYHCIRNAYIMIARYPQYKTFYKKYIHDLFFDNCINSIHCIQNLLIFLKAKKEAKNGFDCNGDL